MAREQFIESKRLAIVRGDLVVAAITTLRLAELAVIEKSWENSYSFLEECRLRFREQGFRSGLVEFGIVSSQRELGLGNQQTALRHAEDAITLAGDIGTRLDAARAGAAAARALLRLGRFGESRSRVAAAVSSIRDSGAIPVLLDLVVAQCQLSIFAASVSDAGVQQSDIPGVLLFVQSHPATWYATKLEVASTLEYLSHAAGNPEIPTVRQFSLDEAMALFDSTDIITN